MILATLSFLHACWWATGEFSLRAVLQGTQVGPGAASRCFFPRLPPSQPLFGAEGSGEPTLTVAAGDVVRLPCSSGVPTPRSTTWTKDGREVVAGGGPGQRLTLLPDGTLNIAEVTPGDEGSYLCSSTLQDNSTFWTQVRLLVTSDPENLTTSVAPGSALANGTLFVLRGSDVSFNCSTSSRSARRLAWTFGGAAASNGSLVSTVGASLDFRIAAVQPGPSGPLRLQVPGHRRSAGGQGQRGAAGLLGRARSPSPPLPKGEPLVMVQKGDSITLTCTEEESTPPANTTWRKGLLQEAVVPGFKYTLAEEGPVRRLTIHNVSGDDQGVYFCRSENLLGVRELEVYLTVRTSSAYTGVIIGVFVAAVIVASPIVFAKSLYSNRHRVCLGNLSKSFHQATETS
uniref:Ig-like domain-containing protein n=1 Tax=Tetraodon nigroviridis TaxID=99883 RepID=H3DDU6_TETNG